jgi:hypothetical protein
MDGSGFVRILSEAFAPFLKALGFSMGSPSISGRMYDVEFRSKTHVLDVSYEPGDEYLSIFVCKQEDWGFPNIDNLSIVPRLSDLNKSYMQKTSKEERIANDPAFLSIHPEDEQERSLLKAAKELRLVLPIYLSSPEADDNSLHRDRL